MAWAMTEERRGLLRPVWGGVDPSIEALAVVYPLPGCAQHG